jgi:hypothetical protein
LFAFGLFAFGLFAFGLPGLILAGLSLFGLSLLGFVFLPFATNGATFGTAVLGLVGLAGCPVLAAGRFNLRLLSQRF